MTPNTQIQTDCERFFLFFFILKRVISSLHFVFLGYIHFSYLHYSSPTLTSITMTGYNDPSKLADARALSKSFKEGGKENELRKRVVPTPTHQLANCLSRELACKPSANRYELGRPTEPLLPIPEKAKKSFKSPAPESRFASRPMNKRVWSAPSHTANMISPDAMDFLMRKGNTPPGNRLFIFSLLRCHVPILFSCSRSKRQSCC